MSVTTNLNLQKSNNYRIVIKSNNLVNTEDMIFETTSFRIPNLNILVAKLGTITNPIRYPAQGKMEYEELNLDLLLDDELRGYIQLCTWLHSMKDPEKLLKSHKASNNLRDTILNTNQYPIDYRDIEELL